MYTSKREHRVYLLGPCPLNPVLECLPLAAATGTDCRPYVLPVRTEFFLWAIGFGSQLSSSGSFLRVGISNYYKCSLL